MSEPEMHDDTPRYEQIAEYLRRVADDTPPDARMPSDADLCAEFGVSRMTARQAVQLVVNEGLVYRKRGHGTFRAPRRIHRFLGSPLSFTENMQRRGLRASSEILEFTLAKPSATDATALAIHADDDTVLLERLRFADDRPMAIERAMISPVCSAVLEADLGKDSLHAVMIGLGHTPTKAHATVSARKATKRERDLLDLNATGVVLVERRVISDQDGVPLEHTQTLYAADRYEFDAMLYSGDTENAP
ncbi:MAG: GntR family transcriptional regulator [Acidimicrobiia bacterium]